MSEFHVLDDLRGREHAGTGRPGELVSTGEQCDSAAGRQSALELDGAADVAGVSLAAGLLDVGPDRVEFASERFDVLGSEVGVFLDVADGHVAS